MGGIPNCRTLKQAAVHLLILPCQGLLFPHIKFVRSLLEKVLFMMWVRRTVKLTRRNYAVILLVS